MSFTSKAVKDSLGKYEVQQQEEDPALQAIITAEGVAQFAGDNIYADRQRGRQPSRFAVAVPMGVDGNDSMHQGIHHDSDAAMFHNNQSRSDDWVAYCFGFMLLKMCLGMCFVLLFMIIFFGFAFYAMHSFD